MTKGQCKQDALDTLNRQLSNIERNLSSGSITYAQYQNQISNVNAEYASKLGSCDSLAATALSCKQNAFNEMQNDLKTLDTIAATIPAGTYAPRKKSIIDRYNAKYRACMLAGSQPAPTPSIPSTLVDAASIAMPRAGNYTYTDLNGRPQTLRLTNIRANVNGNG